jgi:hypothetical protein
VGLNSNALSDGLRCQYHDPDFVLSSSYGRQSCFVGLPSGNAYDWHVHGTGSPDGGRAYLGSNSLHWGMHGGPASMDTSRLSQMDAIRMSLPVNLGWNGVTSVLSFKHQAGLTSCEFHGGCYTGIEPDPSIDAGIVQVQLANSAGGAVGGWRKLSPFENVYDGQGTVSFVNCTFDPTDDGNDEDDYFFPSDPQRRFGPSSTCYPEFVFSRMGGIFWSAPYDPQDIGAASDGPGLQGSLGPGTWVESKFSLDRWRGRRIRLRFLVTSIEVEDSVSQQEALGWNPTPADDGWYIDDVRVTNTLVSAATVTVDTTVRSGLPACAPGCGSVTAALTATPLNPLPGQTTTLDASGSFADQCPGGLNYRFWSDRRVSGVYGDTRDTLLRDWSPEPILVDLPVDQTTHYAVEVRCGFDPGCAGSAVTEVAFDCPSLAPRPFPYRIYFSDAIRLVISFDADRSDVLRGDLLALRESGGDFDGTVDACLANDIVGHEIEDPAIPDPGQGRYYLVRGADPVPPCRFNSWSTGSQREIPGAGGDRDADLAGDADTCP